MKGVLFVQQNESYSKKYVLRGLHFQWNPYMGKMVRTIHGHMIDIFCDIRKGSPTFGKVVMFDMPMSSDKDFSEWIWVPPGFAHGNLFLQETTIEYMCTGEYSQGYEAGIISDKDRSGLSLDVWVCDPRSDNFISGQL